ncbi:MAG: hypothetical protein ACI8S6_000335 [Myxococcota bacterium]
MRVLWITLLGCVIRYGETVETAVTGPILDPVSYADVEARIVALLSSQSDDVEQSDRLRAAHELASHMKSQAPGAQRVVLDYLIYLIELESRTNPMQMEATIAEDVTVGLPEIVEEELDVEVDRSSRIAPLDTDALRAEAESLSAVGKHEAAMTSLEPCREADCWDAVADLWTYTRDLYVFQQREAAAELFLLARQETDPAAQLSQLKAVAALLSTLLSAHPETPYTAAINRNLRLVEEAIAEQGSE